MTVSEGRPKGPSRRRIALLGALFVSIVALISTWQHSLFLPIFLGAFTWLKANLLAWIKLVTPKLALMLAKNGLVIKLRDTVVKSLTEFAVFTHRPWRRRVLALKQMSVDFSLTMLRRYLAFPLWLRCLIALGVLALTAGSTWVALALLIIPQPIIEWMKKRVVVILQKLGVLRSLDVVWRSIVPTGLRSRWERYRFWTLGRRQVRASRELRSALRASMRKSRKSNK